MSQFVWVFPPPQGAEHQGKIKLGNTNWNWERSVYVPKEELRPAGAEKELLSMVNQDAAQKFVSRA